MKEQENFGTIHYILGYLITTALAVAGLFSNGWIMLAVCFILPIMVIMMDSRTRFPAASLGFTVLAAMALALRWSTAGLLLPVVLSAATMVIAVYFILRMKNIQFYEGMIYTVAAAMTGMVMGVVILYIIHDQTDLVLLYGEQIMGNIRQMPNNPLIDALLTSFSAQVQLINDGAGLTQVMEYINQSMALSHQQKLDIVLPALGNLWQAVSAAYLMKYAILSGLLAWYIPLNIQYRKVARTQEGPALKPPPFTAFRMSRWFTNTLMLLLLVVLLLQFSGGSRFLTAMIAIQHTVMLLLSLQGLSTMAWILKKNRFPLAARWVILIILTFLGNTLAWIGIIDVVFNIRLFLANKQNIQRAVALARKIRKENEDKLRHMDPTQYSEEDDATSDNDTDSQHQPTDDSDESDSSRG